MKNKKTARYRSNDPGRKIIESTLDGSYGGYSGQRRLLQDIQDYLNSSYRLLINPLDSLRDSFPEYKWKWWEVPIAAMTPREICDAIRAFDFLWLADTMHLNLVGARRTKRLEGFRAFNYPIFWADHGLNRDLTALILNSEAFLASNDTHAHAIAGALMSDVSFPEGKLLPSVQVMCANLGKKVAAYLSYRDSEKKLDLFGTLKDVEWLNSTNYVPRMQDHATILVLHLVNVLITHTVGTDNELMSHGMEDGIAIHEIVKRTGWVYQPDTQKVYLYCPQEVVMRDSVGWIIQGTSLAKDGPTSFTIRI